MLSGIAGSIKDLSHEMKSAVMALKETLQLNMTSTESRIAQRKTSHYVWLFLICTVFTCMLAKQVLFLASCVRKCACVCLIIIIPYLHLNTETTGTVQSHIE